MLISCLSKIHLACLFIQFASWYFFPKSLINHFRFSKMKGTYSEFELVAFKLKGLHHFARFNGENYLKQLKTCFDKYGWEPVINYQFDPTFNGKEDGTLLSSAVVKGCEETVLLLIKKGAIVDLPNLVGLRTPLHDSVRMGSERITKILLQNGANPNVFDFTNCSPIHFASRRGEPEMIKLLINYGANINAKMNQQMVKSDSPLFNGQKQSALEITMCSHSIQHHKGIDCMKTIMYLGHLIEEKPMPMPVHPKRNKEFTTYLENTFKPKAAS